MIRRVRLPKVTAFRLGIVAGIVVLVPLCLYRVGPEAAFWAVRGTYMAEVLTNGADISRNGGSRVVIRREAGNIVQTCNGACDDLRYLSGDNQYGLEVQVLDAKGACVACEGFHGPGPTNGRQSWTVAEDEGLKIVVRDSAGDASAPAGYR